MTSPEDFDKPWKIALENFFPEFMEFYFPDAAAQIDWGQGHHFLDKELQKVVPEAESAGAHVDKLVKVVLDSGQEKWVCVHVEVQAQPEHGFPARMFRYNYRIYDRYERMVASLAILADEDPDWRPDSFGYELFHCHVGIDFPTVKLLGYNEQIEDLLESDNPFALVTAAHLQTQQTRDDATSRYDAKWRLMRLLCERGWSRENIQGLFHVINWLMQLPESMEERLMTEYIALEEGLTVEEMCSHDRVVYKQAAAESEAKLIRRLLKKRFGDLPEWVDERLDSADTDTLEEWGENLLDAESLEEVFE